jgi:peptidoglycan/LPS O-acetylase OafA/YrhL
MKKIESLTFLRFFAALIVVVFHFGRNTGLAGYASPFIVAGPQMVSLFFVLSGFVLMVSHYRKDNETLRDYYVTRIARIIPIYMLALLLSVCLYYGSNNNNVTALLLNFTFLQSWFPPYPLSLNTPAWSLSVEAFFYLTFPFILSAIKKSNISWQSLMIVSFVFYFFTQAILSGLLGSEFYTGIRSTSHDLIYYFPPSHYCSFLLGISGGLIYSKHAEWFGRTGFLPFILFIVTLCINYIALQYPGILGGLAGFPLAYASSFYSLLFLFLVLSLAYSRNVITRIMSLPFLVLLGESSYSLYILQKPMYTIYTRYILKYISVHMEISPDARFYIFVCLLIFISVMSFQFIEKPGKKIILNFNARMKENRLPKPR